MGGGKSTTYRDLQAGAIFNEKDDLYVKDMVRLFALTKKVDPVYFTKSMIDYSRKYFSPETFEAMGVGVRNTAEVKSLTYTKVLDHIKLLYPHNLHAMYYYAYQDNTMAPISIPAHKINESLMNKYVSSTDNFSKDFTHSFTMDIVDSSSTCDRMTVKDVYASLHSGSTGPDVVDYVVTTPAYEVEPGLWYSLKDETISETMQVTLLKLDASWNETTEERLITVTEDLRVMYLYKVAYSDEDCGDEGHPVYPDDPLPVWAGEEYGIFYKDDIIADISEFIFLLFPLKANKQLVDTPAYQTAVIQGFGLGNGVLDGSIADKEVRNAILGYSTFLDNPDYKDVFDPIYGVPENRNHVTFQSDYYTLNYDVESCLPTATGDGCEDSPPMYTIYFNNEYSVGIDGNSECLAMVPVNYFRELGVRDRYNALRHTFRLWANTKVTVETKWYQSGLFKFAMMAVAIIASVLTGNPAPAIMMMGMQIVSNYLSPEIMAVIAIVAAAYGIISYESAGNTALVNTTSYFAMSASLIQATINLPIVIKADNLQDEIEQTQDKNKKLNEQLASETRKIGFYSPFDSYDTFSRIGSGSVAYSAFDTFYGNTYNYDSRSFKEGIYLS